MVQAIVYISKAGHTKAYAELLGQETSLPVYELKEAKRKLSKGTAIVYLGWLLGGTIKGYAEADKRFDVKAVCGVGMSPDNSQLPEIREKNHLAENFPVFVLQGGFEMEKLHGIYKLMMKFMKATLGKTIAKSPEKSPEEAEMLDMMLNGKDCVSKERLQPVIDYLKR